MELGKQLNDLTSHGLLAHPNIKVIFAFLQTVLDCPDSFGVVAQFLDCPDRFWIVQTFFWFGQFPACFGIDVYPLAKAFQNFAKTFQIFENKFWIAMLPC